MRTHKHRLVLGQNKKDLLTNWYKEGKLEPSEELGDLVSAAGDKDMALAIYTSCNASGKVWRDEREVGALRWVAFATPKAQPSPFPLCARR